MATLKQIIPEEMLRNMEMLAVTNTAMRDILDQAKVIYELAGAPEYYDVEADIDVYETDEECNEAAEREKLYQEVIQLYQNGIISRDYYLNKIDEMLVANK